MKKVLYLTNIEVPYRVRFFNELAQHCDLTVLYESRASGSRNKIWAKSETICHRVEYLRSRMDITGILKQISSGYDAIIIGCYNSRVQMLAILLMRLLRIPYIINLDGETFLEGRTFKNRMKRFFLSGAEKYLVAGEKAAVSIKSVSENKTIIPYYFSSLSEKEVGEHKSIAASCERENTILVVGQYFQYKGMDIALEAARMDPSLHYKFVGMGSRTKQFLQEHSIPDNVEIIPFLQKPDLEKEYQSCAMLVLPSRQECWGLVINEAASFGMPIVSTWGSGAAVEFLGDDYPQYLAEPGNGESLYQCICALRDASDKKTYSDFLLEKSKAYTIEASVQAHIRALYEE